MFNIDVMIPVYNCKQYLQEAIDSVLKQPYANINIVLIDDGSTDGSAELCDEIAAEENRIHVIHQKNQGVSVARNSGIEYILTKRKNGLDQCYIAFLDADDKWSDDFFDDSILSLFTKGYSLIGFQSCVCNGDISKRVQASPIKPGLHPGGATSVWLHSSQHFCAMFYSAQLLQQYEIRFVPGLKYTEDKIFSMQCLYLAENVWLENKLLHFYRMVQNSAMHRRKFGIAYYVPIIDAYLASDKSMSRWNTPQKGELREGSVIAGIYIMDMIDEHYLTFGCKQELDKLFSEKPEYLALMVSPLTQSAKQTHQRWEDFNAHQWQFRLRCYLRGIIFKIKRSLYMFLYKNRYITAIVDKKRYPVMIEK